MDYARLVQKLGALYSLLRDLQAAGLYQGEHTISFTGADGTERILHVHIDGTELELFDSAADENFRLSATITPEVP